MSSMCRTSIFATMLLLVTLTSAQGEVQYLNLLGRSVVDGYRLPLAAADRTWLKSKKNLVLGVSVEDIAPPFEFGLASPDYEGLIADYAALLGQLLNIEIKVRRYEAHSQALEALRVDEIDILPMTHSGDFSDVTFAFSAPYSDDRQVLVSREDPETLRASNLSGQRIAIVGSYRRPEVFQSVYPQAEFQVYPSVQSAIGAVAFGKADAYLGEAIRANYLINKNYLNDLQVLQIPAIDHQQFSFLLRKQDVRLLRIVNSAIAAIPFSERLNILRRWSAGGDALSSQFFFNHTLTQEERHWLHKHPTVGVIASKYDIPLSFVDGKGRFRGITADALSKVSLLTGLKFELRYENSLYPELPDLSESPATFVAGLAKSRRGAKDFDFTRPYMIEPVVLVNRIDGNSISALEQMDDKRLAVLRDSPASDFIEEHFPQIRLVETSSVTEMLALLHRSEVDAAAAPLHAMRYQIKKSYSNSLQISGSIDRLWMQASFATPGQSPLLYSILNKALLSIPPKDMDDLTGRWQGDFTIDDSYWARHRQDIIELLGAGLTALLIALFWLGYLMRQVRKRRQAERALREQMAFMRVVINGTPHPIYVRDRNGYMLICNSGYLDTVRLTSEQVIGTLLNDSVLAPPSAQQLQQVYHHALKHNVSVLEDRVLTLTSGQVLTVYHWVLPYHDDSGAVAGIICGWLDIGERQQLLNQLNEAKEEAEIANRAKTTFLAIMSHEIRTPMNAVIGMLEMMLKSHEIRSADQFSLEVAAGAARELQNLVGDILDIARIESGRLSLTPARMSLRDIVQSALRMFEGGARQKGLQLRLAFNPAASCDVWGDALRIKQIVSNLLSNAIKFSPKGEVLLQVRAMEDTTDEVLSVLIEVKDGGIGISAEDQLKLFCPFSQASNNNQSGRNGSGLGLTISRSLCEMMGGTLTLTSALGQGTQVSFSLRLPTLSPLPAQEDEQDMVSPLSKSLNVLVIDDYPANRLLLIQQLEFLGHRVVSAHDGIEGLSAWRKGAFDAVITDINMPFMQGGELARTIRQEELARGLSACRIFGFTANARPEERDNCLLAGMDDCLFKPVRLKDLSDLLGIARKQALVEATRKRKPGSASEHVRSLIDISSIRELARNDQTAIDNLLNHLRTSNIEDLQRLSELDPIQNISAIGELAHRVKGGAQVVRMHDLIKSCEDVESACSTQNGERLGSAIIGLEHAMRALEMALESQ